MNDNLNPNEAAGTNIRNSPVSVNPFLQNEPPVTQAIPDEHLFQERAAAAQRSQQFIPQNPQQFYGQYQQPQPYNQPYQPYAQNYGGVANAYPPIYTYQKSPQEIERDNIRQASNVGGKLTIAIFVTMLAVAVIIMIVGFFSGIVQDTPTTSDPYMGFTPMGFYIYEGLTSLVSIFLPALIIMNSVKKNKQMKTEDFLPFKYIEGKKLAALVFGGMAFCMVAQMMAVILSINFSIIGFDINDAVDTTYGTKPLDVVMNSICTAMIPALVEEFAYRGVVLGALKKYDTNLAIIGSAYLFGMLHGNLAQIPFAFALGIVFAYIRVKTDSMMPNILIHFGNNFYAVIISTIDEVAPDSISTIIDVAIMVMFVAIGFICVYYLTKSDKNFFKLEPEKSTTLNTKEKMKTFFTSGTVIASTIILCIETITVIKML